MALGITAAAVGAARGQEVTREVAFPPPFMPSVDENGVDVNTGDEIVTVPLLSIGPDGMMGLQLSWSSIGGEFRDEFSNGYSSVETEWGTAVMSSSFGSYGDVLSTNSPPTHGKPGMLYETADGAVVQFDVFKSFARDPSTETYYYEYMASSITYPNGVRWQLHYISVPNPPGTFGQVNNLWLMSVTSNTGFQIKFQYTAGPGGNPGTLASATAINNAIEYCDPLALTCSLTQAWPQALYSPVTIESGTQAQVMNLTDATGAVTRLRWKHIAGTTGSWFAIKRPASTVDDATYYYTLQNGPCWPVVQDPRSDCQAGAPRRVSSVVTPEKTVNYTYSQTSDRFVITAHEPDLTTNRYEIASINAGRGLRKWVDRLGRASTFQVNAFGEITSVTFPEGNRRDFVRGYNMCGGVTSETAVSKPSSGAPTLTRSATYVAHGLNMKLCGKPASRTDFRNNATTYTYSPDHGGVLTELLSPDSAGIRPATKFYYAQRYATTKNSSGGNVQAATPVWLLTETRSCRSSTLDLAAGTCAGGSADLVQTTFDYGPASGTPNNLLLRGKTVAAGGEVVRTCYGYDRFGRKVSETAPNANLGNCP